MVLATTLGLLLILWALLQLPAVQGYIKDRLVNTLSKGLGVHCSIDKVNIAYFDHLQLHGVLVEDEHGDTLIYAAELEADYDIWSWKRQDIRFDRVRLKHGELHMRTYPGESSSNIRFFIEYFASGEKKGSDFELHMDELLLDGGTFSFINDNDEDSPDRDFNEANMRFHSLSAELHDFAVYGDSLVFRSKRMSGKEHCGLEIVDLVGNGSISPTEMVFTDMRITTPRSSIGDRLRFTHTSFDDFSDFINKVVMEAHLDDTRIHSSDLAYFTNSLKVYDDLIWLQGHGGGTVADIRIDGLEARIGSGLEVKGGGRISGIPDIPRTNWDLKFQWFKGSSSELVRLAQMQQAPDPLLRLEWIGYKGTFRGLLQDFELEGLLSSQQGELNTKLALALDGIQTRYRGSIRSEAFQLGQLAPGSELGETAFDLQFNGKGSDPKSMTAEVEGRVSRLDYNGYSYRQIAVDGRIAQDLFVGTASINDPNAIAGFDGSMDLSKDHSVTKAQTTIQRLDLKALGFTKEENTIRLVGLVNVSGNHIDSLSGSVMLDSMNWYGNGQEIPIGASSIRLVRDEKEQRLDVRSDLVDAELRGNFPLSSLGTSLKHLLEEVYIEQHPELQSNQNLYANLRIKKFHPLLKTLTGGASFQTARLELDFDESIHRIHATASADGVNIVNLYSNQLDFELKREGLKRPAEVYLNLSSFAIGDSTVFHRMRLDGEVRDTGLSFGIVANGDDELSIDLKARADVRSDSMVLAFQQFNSRINHKEWGLGMEDARIVYHDQLLELFYFDFRSKQESIFFDAAFGAETKKINLILSNFLLENTNPFLAGTNTELQGVANGPVDLTFVEGFPMFESFLDIEDLALNGDTLGRFQFNSEHRGYRVLSVNGSLDNGLFSGMHINGLVDFNRPDSSLSLAITTTGSSIRPFQKYLASLASDLDGKMDADLSVIGALSSPQVTGTAHFSDLSFKVNYLQTTYRGQALLDVENNLFTIRNAQLYDRRGKKGRASGTIRHRNYSDFVFDITIDQLQDFLCLNTSRKDNELFYGTAYADGKMSIKGPLDDLLLSIDAKSKSGTRISIPLDNAEQSGQLSHVQFVDLSKDNNQLKSMVRTQEGVRMDFHFEVTNDAQVELIFDELLGDKIKGRAHGDLRMAVNTYGEFNMFGNVTIDQGDYLFTAFNIINKYFVVEPGSTLSWDGDIYDAKLDLKAIKREYPRPATLLAGFIDPEEEDNYNTPIPVDCELILSGLLFNPDISFDLSLPSSGTLGGDATSTFNTVIGRVKQDKEELDRQVFSLLVLGTFMPPSFGNSSYASTDFNIQSSFNNSLSDFISAQLSNWLSQIDPKLQVGIDYQAAQAATGQLDPEIVLSLRRKIVYDMLEFQGSYDAGASNNNPFDLNLQIDLNQEGTFKARGFWRNANDPTLGNLNNVTTFGVGVFYRYQFDHFWFEKERKRSLDTDDLRPSS